MFFECGPAPPSGGLPRDVESNLERLGWGSLGALISVAAIAIVVTGIVQATSTSGCRRARSSEAMNRILPLQLGHQRVVVTEVSDRAREDSAIVGGVSRTGSEYGCGCKPVYDESTQAELLGPHGEHKFAPLGSPMSSSAAHRAFQN